MKNKVILITGGAGFVGSNLAHMLLAEEPKELIIVDNLLSSERPMIPDSKKVTFIHGSIADDRILGELPSQLNYVFHLATFHGNQNSIFDPIADHANNTFTTLKLFETLKDFPHIKKIVYSSAGCTVAEKTFDAAEPTREDAPVSLYLDSPYQLSKIFGEYYSNYYFSHHKLPIVKARFQNVYGPGEILGAGKWRGTYATVWRNVVPTFIYRSIKSMPLIVENEGRASRDFIYVTDIVRGLVACAKSGTPGEVYNLASGTETSILQLAKLINQLTGNSTQLEMGPKRPWDNSGHRFGSVEKAKEELDFIADTPITEGLRNTIQWTKDNMDQIDHCVNKHADKMEKITAFSS